MRRVWYLDKVKDSKAHMPVSFPLDPQLSALTFAYLAWFRGALLRTEDRRKPWAFLGPRGGKLDTANYYQWLKTHLNFDLEGVETLALTFHRFRNIALATYGLKVHFAQAELEHISLAMRHTYEIMTRNYLNDWARWYQDAKSVAEITEHQGMPVTPEWNALTHTYVETLQPLPPDLLNALQQLMWDNNDPPNFADALVEDGGDMFIVERILRIRGKRPNRSFFVKWEGFPDSANSWEPEGNFAADGLRELLDAHRAAGAANVNIVVED